MKSFFKKMAIMLICVSIFLSYMPWNVVFATDEIAETPQNVITEEPQGSGEATNPEEGNTQLENPKSNAEITEELQGEPSQANEESTIENIVKNVKDKVQNVLKSGQAPTRAPKNPEDYFIFNESTNTITGYSSSPDAPKDIKIPATINGVNVEHIGNNAFSGQQLTGLSFELPSSLKSIGSNAFYNNTTLKGDVKIPNGVASIGGYAFYNCGSLTSITIPEGVTSIGDHAFSYCGSLTSIAIPEGVTSIENDAFYACQSLTSIAIPKSVTRIGGAAFSRCSSLRSITIPKGVTEIYGSTFSDCSSLRSITIPETVTSIWNTAFYSCSSLTSITIPESVVSIGENVFYCCYSLTKINIPTKTRGEISGEPWGANNAIVYWKDTKVVDDYVVDITKGEIVKYIGTKVDLTVPSSFNIDGKECKINSIFNSAFFENKNIKNVNIQQGITSIGSFAFDGCSSLTSISIPEGMTRIGDFAFHDCKSLTEVTIPKGVTSIGDQAFTGCSSIASITIPESVVSIGNLTFQNCSSLRSITLSEGLKSIGEQAFRSCSSLTSITIPESMTSIGHEAFIYCNSLKKINIPTKTRGEISGEPWDADNAIVYWKDTKIVDDFVVDITKGEIVKYIGTKVDLTVPSSFNIDGKECKINSIFESAFFRNKNIKNVNIQQGITSIGKAAFNSCSSLTSITIPESVTSIGDFAFGGCTSLRSITIPGVVTEIRGGTFSGCKSLTSITMPESITRINTSAFQDCSSLASITIPESVTCIDMCAFQNCSSLASITIPESVTGILSNAFGGCTSLRKINIPKGTDIIPNDAFKDSGIETIYVDQNRSDSRIVRNQPWGASNTTKVFYKGEFVSIDTTTEKVKGEYARNIKIEAYIDKQKLVSKIVMPDGKVINVGNPTWTGEFKATKNGTYVFKGYDDSGNESEKVVTIDDIGKPIVSAENATIDYEPKKISKAELYKLLNASAIDELDVDVPVTVTDADLEKVKKIKNGETVEVTVKATHPKFNLSDSKKVCVTLNLPNIIPGSQNKPEGYVTVTFAKGDHGKLEGELSQHVNPTKVTDLKTLAPKVKADIGFKHIGWDKELKAKFDKDTTITATYEALPDTVPGSQEKPAGYVTVTFAKGEHGSLSGELSQHVNPTKVTDLKTLAPKVKADIGFKHIGWDKELKAKFDKDTTITATYEEVPDTVPGSQEKPAGYVTVTFAKGDHGSLSGEMSQHVNPTKVTDLKTLAPKVKADIGFKHTGWNSELKKKFTEDTTITATYEALPDTVPGSQEKPAGYVTVTFAKGEHGSLSGETSQHVNPTKVTDLKTLAPKVTADTGFKHTGWNSELKKKFTEDTTITATYEEVPDTVPGSQEKPAGYVTVTFAKGEHGSLSGEMSQHVNPTKITDLKTLAPKVKADVGFKHTGWDKALKAKFDKDTTITATYEALPDTVPGSQEKPAGYVTVTFAKGEHGKLDGELSQHVNPTKVTDLKILAPKVKADIGFKHTGWNGELKKKFTEDTTITATYEALPDVIPGSQEKPAGYVTVTFAKGDHGSLSGELSQHVNPTKVTDLKTLAPKVKADIGFKHIGWDKELKAKFDKDTTVTATYEALPDVIPGSQDKPEGYVTVTFAKGDHGKLEGELSQHVNPTKVTDLKTLAPKVKADIGFKHIGWDKELKAKFDKDTTITATYEALPDVIPGSQDKPEGYVTVTFAKGEHGKLEGELSQHVNPTKVTDLKALAPKVKADIGFKHIGWDKALKAKFEKDTTVTATYEAVTEKFAITIDPDGGSWNGSTDPIVYNIEKGEYITLPDAPTKEGYTFKYWKGSKYMPGDKYKVEGEHKFTAVWEKKATSKTDDSSTGKAGTSGTAGANGANANKTSTSNHAPFTADSQNVMLYLMMSIFSFVLMLKLRSQEN